MDQRFGVLDLGIAGTLENERTTFRGNDYTVELDRMRFADGGEEFELEVESDDPDGARAWCGEILAALGIELRASTETKYERVLRRGGS